MSKNKFEAILESTRYFSKALGHMSYSALYLNSSEEETRADFIASKRTGQCAIAVQLDLERVGSQYVPDDQTDNKVRYLANANNKVNFLLENPERINTFPSNEVERTLFETRKIFGGGIRDLRHPFMTLVAVSGFHPKIDEACSIVFLSNMVRLDNKTKIHYIKELSLMFKNPYALILGVGCGSIKGVTEQQAREWSVNKIT